MSDGSDGLPPAPPPRPPGDDDSTPRAVVDDLIEERTRLTSDYLKDIARVDDQLDDALRGASDEDQQTFEEVLNYYLDEMQVRILDTVSDNVRSLRGIARTIQASPWDFSWLDNVYDIADRTIDLSSDATGRWMTMVSRLPYSEPGQVSASDQAQGLLSEVGDTLLERLAEIVSREK